MSNVSSRHSLVKLTKTTVALTDQRLVRLIAKKAKDDSYSPNLTESLAVSVPRILDAAIMEHINALLPHIGVMLESAQDSIVRELRLEDGRDIVTDEDISLEACIEFLDAESRGGRLTKEFLESWFNEGYSEAAAEFICTMNRWTMTDLSEDQLKIVTQKCNVLCGMFSGFSSGKYSPDIPRCRAMVKFGEFAAPVADARMITYTKKAAEILRVKTEELSADALGF